MYKHFFKRLIDFFLSLLVLLIIWPILLLIMIWLHFANKDAGVFFLQERPGLNGKIFKVIKFKTMTDERDLEGKLLPDDVRLTKIGEFVRSMSIDELPQLINVLKGDMALIGPRPLLVQYLPLYNSEQARRHEVRPGITGWAQVHGRNLLLLSKKFEYDVWYVDHLSLRVDIKILYLSIIYVFKRRNVGEGALSMKQVDDLNFAERMSNKPIMINESLILRKPELSDLKELLALKNNKKASELLGGITPIYLKEDIIKWINFHRYKEDEKFFVIYDKTIHKLIGHVGLYNIDFRISKAEFGILIADDSSRGKGYGDVCLKHMLKVAFEQLYLNKIELSYIKDNLPAGKLYLKNGFIQEGCLKQEQYKNGRYYDVVLMAKFNDNYK